MTKLTDEIKAVLASLSAAEKAEAAKIMGYVNQFGWLSHGAASALGALVYWYLFK